LRWHRKEKKEEGPFKANRILDTKELKVDQVFTGDGEKPVAVFVHTIRMQRQKLEVKGTFGLAGGEIERKQGKERTILGFYHPANISENAVKERNKEIVAAAIKNDNEIPNDILLKEIGNTNLTLPASSSAFLELTPKGSAAVNGSITLSGSSEGLRQSLAWIAGGSRCRECGSPIPSGSEYCKLHEKSKQ